VNEPFLAVRQFHESAEVHDARDLARINISDFNIPDDAFNDFLRFFGAVRVNRCDIYHTVVLNVDFDACIFNNFINDFAAAADDFPDLVDGNLHGNNPGRILGQFVSRLVNDREHFASMNIRPSFAPVSGRWIGVLVDAVYLDIQLDGRDALFRARYLKDHVA
jgi:hypothetical protein